MLWVGADDTMEGDLVRKAGVAFRAIPAAGVHGVGVGRLPGNILRLMRGFNASRKILREYRPQALFFTGGYVAVPMALAGRGLPSLVYVPDIEPGLAIRAASRLADTIAVTTEDSQAWFPTKHTLVSGYPLRADLQSWDRARGQEFLHLRDDLPTLLVTGGSRGARSINRAVLGCLGELLAITQVVWTTGTLDWEEVQRELGEMNLPQRDRLHVQPYLHEMGAALSAADLVVSRAGASALGEYPAFGLPALLVPYPYAWRYQKVNATWLEERGAARMVRDEDLAQVLLPLVTRLLSAEGAEELAAMRKAMQRLARPDAAVVIADELLSLVKGEEE